MAKPAQKSGNSPETMTVEEKEGSTDQIGGKITLSEQVVATIAGLAAREIEGIYKVGKPRFINLGAAGPTHGVAAEVGEVEAALDLDLVLDYGADLRDVASRLRRRVGEEVARMAGKHLIELNINVVDIHLPEKEERASKEQPRVR